MAWLYKQKDSENWWIGYRVNGKQILRSTKTDDRAQAERQLAQIEAVNMAHKAGSLTEEFVRHLTRRTSSNDLSLRAAVRQWLGECKDLSPVTLERYQNVINEFCLSLNATDAAPLLRDIQVEAVAAFLREKRSTTSAATAKLCRRILSAFFNYTMENQLIQHSPVPTSRALKLTKDSKSVRRAFTLAEMKTLFSKAPSPFWQYMVMSGFFLGQRMGDLIQLVWGAVDFENNFVRLTTGKTGRSMVIPLRKELKDFLAGLKQQAGEVKPSDPIWPEQSELYVKRGAGVFSNQFYDEVLLPSGLVTPRTHHAKKTADNDSKGRQVNSVSFHCLRHTFVSMLKMSGSSQSTAKELAGHSSDAVSDLYTHTDEATLTKAISQLPELTK